MKDEIVSFETAKLAKEKGFRPIEDWNPTYVPGYLYDEENEIASSLTSIQEEDWNIEDRYLAPTQTVLQRWLRETHGVAIEIRFGMRGSSTPYLGYFYGCIYGKHGGGLVSRVNYKGDLPEENYTYEQALEEALVEALKQL